MTAAHSGAAGRCQLSRRALLLGLLLAGCSPLEPPAATPAVLPTRASAPQPVVPPTPTPRPTPALPPGARPGGRVVEGVLTLPATLNPLLADDGPARRLAALLYDGLVRVTADTLEPEPALAIAWEISPDGRTYTFHLRDGLTWHDGQAVTARDVVATYQAVAAARQLSLRAASLAGVLDTVQPAGPTSLTMTLRQPYAPFLTELATLPVLPLTHVTAGRSVEDAPAGQEPIGAGPFKLARRTPDQVVLERHAGAWQGPALLDAVELRRLGDPDALVADLASGRLDLVELDLRWLTPAHLERLRNNPTVSLTRYESLALTLLVFQLDPARQPALADARVRRALAYALDRPALATTATAGLGAVPPGTLPPASWASVLVIEPTYPRDLVRAAGLLDAAGWGRGDDGLRRREGQPLALTLVTNTGNRLRSALVAGVADAWRSLGANVAVREEPFDAFVERVVGQGDFDACLLGLDLGPDPDQSALWESSAVRGGYNVNRYSNAQVDRLLVAARAARDRGERTRLYEEVQRLVLTDLPALPLVSPPGLLAIGPRLRNVAPNPADAAHGAARWWVTGS